MADRRYNEWQRGQDHHQGAPIHRESGPQQNRDIQQRALSVDQRNSLRVFGPSNGLNEHHLHEERTGKKIFVLVNRFPLQFLERGIFVTSYQINILPIKSEGSTSTAPPITDAQALSQRDRRSIKKKLARLIISQWIIDQRLPLSSYAYDGGHIVHLTSPLAPVKGETLVEIKEEGRRFPSRFQVTHERTSPHPIDLRVVINPSNAAPGDIAAAFSVIDLVIKQSTVSLPGTETRGNSTYFLPIAPSLPPADRGGPSSHDPMRQQHIRPIPSSSYNKEIGKGAVVSSGFRAVVSKSISQEGRPSISLSIDATVTAAIPEQPMISFMASFFGVSESVLRDEGLRRQPRKEVKAFALEIRNIECKMIQIGSQPPRSFSSVELPRDLKDAVDYTFPVKVADGEERQTSIASYFQTKYSRPLAYPRLPVLQVKPGKNCMIPAELLVIRSKLLKGKPGSDQTACLVTEGALDPSRRKAKILDIVTGASNLMSSPTLSKFGLVLGCDPATRGMERIKAHILPKPTLVMGGNRIIRPAVDGFFEGSNNARFFNPASLESWVVYSMLPRYQVEASSEGRVHPHNSLSDFIRNLKAQGRDRGISFPEIDPPIVYKDDPGLCQEGHNPTWKEILDHCNYQCVLKKFYRKSPSFIVILLDGNGNSREYNQAKEACLTYGLVSQCVSVGRAKLGERGDDRGRRSYIGNLLLKVNAKLGGVNVALDGDMWKPEPLRNKLISVIGIDVNHESEEQPSVAALIASVDRDCTRYICEPLMQAGDSTLHGGGLHGGGGSGGGGGLRGQRQEIIDAMKPAMRSLLLRFSKENGGQLPEVLVVMRDGVGESQVNSLVEIECEQIKEACIELNLRDIPLIVLVLEKRHNIRIFPDDRGRDRGGDLSDSQTKKGNVLPGTIVEGLFTGHSVTDNPYQDFLLVSHAGSIGTVRGVRHTKVVDEIGLTPDEVHRMCYSLTHLMCRSMRSVSLPAALFYADLAAKLARCLLKYEGPDGSSDSSARAARDHSPLTSYSSCSFYSMAKVREPIQDKQYFV